MRFVLPTVYAILLLACTSYASAQSDIPTRGSAEELARGPVTGVVQLAFGVDSAEGRLTLHRYVAPDEADFRTSYRAPGFIDRILTRTRTPDGKTIGRAAQFSYRGDTVSTIDYVDGEQFGDRTIFTYRPGGIREALTESANLTDLLSVRERYREGRVVYRTRVYPVDNTEDSTVFDYTPGGGTERYYGRASAKTWSRTPYRTASWTETPAGNVAQYVISETLPDQVPRQYAEDHAYRYDERGNFLEHLRRRDGDPEYLRLRRVFYDEVPADSLLEYHLYAHGLLDEWWAGEGGAAGQFLYFAYAPIDSTTLREALPSVMTGYVDPADPSRAFSQRYLYFVTSPAASLVLIGDEADRSPEVMDYVLQGDRLTATWRPVAGAPVGKVTYRRLDKLPEEVEKALGWRR